MPESRGPSHNDRRTGLSHPHWKELLRGSDLFDMPAQFSIGNKTSLKRVILVRAYQIACPAGFPTSCLLWLSAHSDAPYAKLKTITLEQK